MTRLLITLIRSMGLRYFPFFRYRNRHTQFQKYYNHYEIRNDAPPAALHRASLFGSWFWS